MTQHNTTHPALVAMREVKAALTRAAELASQEHGAALLTDEEAVELVHALGEIVSTIRHDFACGEYAIDTEAELAADA